MMCSKIMMYTTVNSWPLSKCSGTGGITYIKQHIQSRSTLITQISCTGKTPEITTEEWCAGMQNLWNMTSNWYISQERRMDGPTHYLDAWIMIKVIMIMKNLWCYHPSFSAKCTTNMSTRRNTHPQQESLEVKKRIQIMDQNGDAILQELTPYHMICCKRRLKRTKKPKKARKGLKN